MHQVGMYVSILPDEQRLRILAQILWISPQASAPRPGGVIRYNTDFRFQPPTLDDEFCASRQNHVIQRAAYYTKSANITERW